MNQTSITYTSSCIPDGVRNALQESTFSGPHMDVPQIDAAVYQQLKKVIECLGGKWNKSLATHVFPYFPEAIIQQVIEAGKYPKSKPLAYFPTPTAIVDDLIEGLRCALAIAEVRVEDGKPVRILEPSAGQGAIIEGILNRYSGWNLIALTPARSRNPAPVSGPPA